MTKTSFLLWLLEHWRISSGELQGTPYDFRRYPCLQAIAEDEHDNIVIQKAAQCGISELAIARLLWLADTRPGNSLYGFPRTSQLKEFVDARVRGAILNNPYLLKKINGAMNLHRIEFGGKQLYFRGSQARRQMLSVDVSHLFLDEVDEMEEGVIYTLQKRLGASSAPTQMIFSTPTYPGVGINREFSESDGREWFIPCPHCGKHSRYLWEKRMDGSIGCEVCSRPLPSDLLHAGQWVPAMEHREWHGYHISKLFVSPSSLPKMIKDTEDPLKWQELYNSDLGLPYEPHGSKIDLDILRGCWGNYTRVVQSDTPTVLGIDVGKVLHVVVAHPATSPKMKVVTALSCGWDDLSTIIAQFTATLVMVDAQPEQEQVRRLQQQYHHRVWAMRYPAWPTGDMELFRANYVKYQVDVNRTYAMMMVMQLLKSKELILPRDMEAIPEFPSQMMAPILAQKDDEHGARISFFPRTGTADHYYHSMVYAMIGCSMQPRTFHQILKGWF